jgi:hypothetical protein
VTSEAEGLLLRVGGDPRVGAVPGGAQPLSTAARVDGTSGSNRWQIVIPHAIIDALPVQLRGPVISGQPDRLNPAMFEDLLLFVVH